MYKHLTPGGLLAITRWLRTPPRDSVKLFATAVLALEKAGVSLPGDQPSMKSDALHATQGRA